MSASSAAAAPPAYRGVAEALAFVAAALLYIWVLRHAHPWTIWPLTAAVAAVLARRGETARSLGLALPALGEALWRFRFPAAMAVVLVSLVLGERLASAELWTRGGKYLLWCCLQQLLLQTMVYRPMRPLLGASPGNWGLSGLLFGVAHLPNPVLAPATALWGAVSCWMFERENSIWVPAFFQLLLSSALYELTPWEWHRGFRVGPGFFIAAAP